jgi:hypothetical protein
MTVSWRVILMLAYNRLLVYRECVKKDLLLNAYAQILLIFAFDYTDFFYIIYRRGFLFFKYKAKPDRAMPTGEIKVYDFLLVLIHL